MNAIEPAALDTGLARVHALSHTRIDSPMLGPDAGFSQRMAWLIEEIARQVTRTRKRFPGGTCMSIICTTTLSKMLTGWDRQAQGLFDQLEARTGLRPAALVQAYQCAGWGFAMRFAVRHTAERRLLLSIVDADLHEMMGAGYEAAIDKIGFGVTTVALELAPELPTLRCEGPFPNHGFTELLHAVCHLHEKHGPTPTFLPFLQEGLAAIAQRCVGEPLARNRHAVYGHTFGADPWIGLSEWLQTERPADEREVTLGAFAFDGYFTVGNFQVGPHTAVELRTDALHGSSK